MFQRRKKIRSTFVPPENTAGDQVAIAVSWINKQIPQ